MKLGVIDACINAEKVRSASNADIYEIHSIVVPYLRRYSLDYHRLEGIHQSIKLQLFDIPLTHMPTRRRLQHLAIAISILSVFYSAAEGIVSILFGLESSSRSLVFFGIQSAIEVASSVLVVWRFFHVIKPGDETVDTEQQDSSIKFVLCQAINESCS